MYEVQSCTRLDFDVSQNVSTHIFTLEDLVNSCFIITMIIIISVTVRFWKNGHANDQQQNRMRKTVIHTHIESHQTKKEFDHLPEWTTLSLTEYISHRLIFQITSLQLPRPPRLFLIRLQEYIFYDTVPENFKAMSHVKLQHSGTKQFSRFSHRNPLWNKQFVSHLWILRGRTEQDKVLYIPVLVWNYKTIEKQYSGVISHAAVCSASAFECHSHNFREIW